MKIQYDRSARIAGIGMVPWTRLGPERWFDDYKIASLYGWDLAGIAGAPDVCSLADAGTLPVLERINSQHLIRTAEFQQLITSQLAGYNFLTYKPLDIPEVLLQAGCHFLSMNQKLTTTLENKAAFRRQFADLALPFPAYRIIERAAVRPDETGLQDILQGRESVILQDEQMGGGRGTYRVSSVADLTHALDSIERLSHGDGVELVISDLVPQAAERSVQCVVTRYGVFIGPLQKQIVGNPLLANLSVPDGDRFCGAEITPNDVLSGVYPEIRKYAEAIGKRLQERGYRGIFGLDCLVGKDGRVYVLEINPRLTGVTPLQTMLYREGQDIPFYLLHILETGGFDYTIEDSSVNSQGPEGGLLVLHSRHAEAMHITDAPASGLYAVESLDYLGKAYKLPTDQPQTLLAQQYTPPGFRIKPGGRLMTMYASERILDDEDVLTPPISAAVEHILQQIQVTAAPPRDSTV